jgi:hypothetical protein
MVCGKFLAVRGACAAVAQGLRVLRKQMTR